MAWLEISLRVDGEMAEAVADVLARFAPGGVATEADIHFESADDPGTPDENVVVRAYLPAEKAGQIRPKLEEALWYLGRIRSLPPPTYRAVAAANWMEAWKAHYHPIEVGRKIRIVPAWIDLPPADRLDVRIEPGMAFGTGTHPTTQLALALLEEHIHPGIEVLDVGCGSGILSIAALKLGAGRVLGVDVSPQAIRSARENADLNGIEQARFLLQAGSVDDILAGRFAMQRAGLVLANILAPILLRLFDEGLARLLDEPGVLILSGVMAEHMAPLEARVAQEDLRIQDKRQMGDWYAYALRANG